MRRLRARVEELERDLGRRPAGGARRAGRRARCGPGCCWTRCSRPPRGCAASWPCRRSRARPADAVEAHVAEQGSRDAASGHGSLASDDPALLEQLLALPRVHLVVDGYNVTKTALAGAVAGAAARPAAGRAGAAGRPQRRGGDGRLRRRRRRADRPAGEPAAGRAGALQPGRGDRRRRDPGAGRGRAARAARSWWSPATTRWSRDVVRAGARRRCRRADRLLGRG